MIGSLQKWGREATPSDIWSVAVSACVIMTVIMVGVIVFTGGAK